MARPQLNGWLTLLVLGAIIFLFATGMAWIMVGGLVFFLARKDGRKRYVKARVGKKRTIYL